jgi:hypothetical protein
VLDPRAIHIYTNGSCYGNPGGDSGCAAIVHFPEHLNRTEEQIVDFGCEESRPALHGRRHLRRNPNRGLLPVAKERESLFDVAFSTVHLPRFCLTGAALGLDLPPLRSYPLSSLPRCD